MDVRLEIVPPRDHSCNNYSFLFLTIKAVFLLSSASVLKPRAPLVSTTFFQTTQPSSVFLSCQIFYPDSVHIIAVKNRIKSFNKTSNVISTRAQIIAVAHHRVQSQLFGFIFVQKVLCNRNWVSEKAICKKSSEINGRNHRLVLQWYC